MMSFSLIIQVTIIAALIGTNSSFLSRSIIHQRSFNVDSSTLSTKCIEISSSTSKTADDFSIDEETTILVLGGTGFLGQEIIRQCKERNIAVKSTSTTGVGSTIRLDLTADDAEELIEEISNGCVAVISTVGSIGTKSDLQVNSASSKAAIGAKNAGVKRFVFLGNNKRVRRVTKSVPFLQNYAKGKEASEAKIEELFGIHGCLIKPAFIYGGEEFGVSPPRVASSAGKIAEEVLGLYPIQALSEALPDALGAPLEVPVSVESVAGAAINVALGLVEGYKALDTKDLIVMASASHRPRSCIDEEECSIEEEEKIQMRRDELKKALIMNKGDSSSGTGAAPQQHDDIALMEELESLRPSSTKPAYDDRLNSRWDFVLSKSDMGTEFIKELSSDEESNTNPLLSIIKSLYDLRDVYMEITNEQSVVNIVLKSKLLRQPFDVVLTTSLLPMAYDDETDGTMFVEQFEGIKVAGIDMPTPTSWKRSRYLEISYLDDDMIIARGNAGEPHILLRGKNVK